jgi:hypothetical protein
VIFGLDFPQFLEADAVGLRIGAVAQLEFALDELLAEVAAAAFGEERVFAVQFHARLEVRAFGCRRLRRPMSPVATPLTDRLVEQHFGAGKAGIDLDAQRLGLLAEPAHRRCRAK